MRMNERELSKGKDEFFPRMKFKPNGALIATSRFTHVTEIEFFSGKKTVEPVTGERAVLKFRSDKQRCLHEFQKSAWIDRRVSGVPVMVLNSYWKPLDQLELADYWWRMI